MTLIEYFGAPRMVKRMESEVREIRARYDQLMQETVKALDESSHAIEEGNWVGAFQSYVVAHKNIGESRVILHETRFGLDQNQGDLALSCSNQARRLFDKLIVTA